MAHFSLRAILAHNRKEKFRPRMVPRLEHRVGASYSPTPGCSVVDTAERRAGLVPVVKVSSRTALAERWPDLIDIDAGRIATGGATIEEVSWEIFCFILDVASGRKKTWADHWGLHNALALFNPGPIT